MDSAATTTPGLVGPACVRCSRTSLPPATGNSRWTTHTHTHILPAWRCISAFTTICLRCAISKQLTVDNTHTHLACLTLYLSIWNYMFEVCYFKATHGGQHTHSASHHILPAWQNTRTHAHTHGHKHTHTRAQIWWTTYTHTLSLTSCLLDAVFCVNNCMFGVVLFQRKGGPIYYCWIEYIFRIQMWEVLQHLRKNVR